MHALKTEDGTIFQFNSDLSGDVLIVNKQAQTLRGEKVVSGAALLEFVAEYVRTRQIAKLESLAVDDLLSL